MKGLLAFDDVRLQTDVSLCCLLLPPCSHLLYHFDIFMFIPCHDIKYQTVFSFQTILEFETPV